MAPHLERVIQRWPTVTLFDPRPLALDTFARKFREALVAKVNYGHKLSHTAEQRFQDIYHQIVVRIREDKVVVGPKEETKHAVVRGQPVSEITEVEVNLYLEDFCRLLPHLKPRPCNFVAFGVEPEVRKHLEEHFDVIILPSDSNPLKYHIL